MADTDWIKELKPGDEVIFECVGYYNFFPVTSISDSRIVVNDTEFDQNGIGYIPELYAKATVRKISPEEKQSKIERSFIYGVIDKMYELYMENTEYINDAESDQIFEPTISYSQAVRILEILNEKE